MREFLVGLRNLRLFFWVVWRFRGWDYGFMVRVLAVCFREMRRELSEQPSVCEALELAELIGADEGKPGDVERLGHLFGTYLRRWWD